MAKSPEQMADAMIANLKEKTGKTLAQWTKIAKRCGARHGEIVKALKADHGLTHGYANLIALKTLKSDAGSAGGDDALLAAQYAGPKAALKPIYAALIDAAHAAGAFEIAPKKAYVSLRRAKQFAIIQPSTRTRVDLGLNLKGRPAGKRLEASGSFNAMVSHRVRLTSPEDVDGDVRRWLAEAWSGA